MKKLSVLMLGFTFTFGGCCKAMEEQALLQQDTVEGKQKITDLHKRIATLQYENRNLALKNTVLWCTSICALSSIGLSSAGPKIAKFGPLLAISAGSLLLCYTIETMSNVIDNTLERLQICF